VPPLGPHPEIAPQFRPSLKGRVRRRQAISCSARAVRRRSAARGPLISLANRPEVVCRDLGEGASPAPGGINVRTAWWPFWGEGATVSRRATDRLAPLSGAPGVVALSGSVCCTIPEMCIRTSEARECAFWVPWGVRPRLCRAGVAGKGLFSLAKPSAVVWPIWGGRAAAGAGRALPSGISARIASTESHSQG
jgi:hypothetical protein